jgi:hypothetical protein
VTNANRIEKLIEWETTWPKKFGGRRTTELLGAETRLLAREVLRLRAQITSS